LVRLHTNAATSLLHLLLLLLLLPPLLHLKAQASACE
jgi:hypothetical protein